jgi:hypothetical protein
MRVFGPTRRIRRRLPRAIVLGAVHIVLALAVICGSLQAGARYFYCEALGLSTSDPCCSAPAHSGHDCPVQAIERASVDCCSILTLPSMPRAASADKHGVPPAGLTAILAVEEYARAPVRPAFAGFARGVQRWEGPPRPGGDPRLQTMVFLT